MPFCCGHLQLYDFNVHYPPRGGSEPFTSWEESWADLAKRIQRRIQEDTDSWNSESPDDEEKVACCYGMVSMTLTNHQFPGIVEWLIQNDGWSLNQEVKNPKTSNTLYLLSKAL